MSSAFAQPGSFIRGAAGSLLSRAVLVLISFGVSILLARVLGPDGRGVYAVGGAITAIAVQIGNVGLHMATARSLARDASRLPALLANAVVASLAIGGVIGVAIVAIAIVVPDFAPLPMEPLLISSIAIPVGLAYLNLGTILLGLQRIRAWNFAELANRSGSAAGLLILAGAGALTASSALATVLVALTVVTVIGLGLVGRGATGRIRPDRAIAREHIAYGLRAYFAALFTFLVLRVDVLMVNAAVGAASAGQYAIATNLGDLIGLGSVVVATVLFSRLSAMTDDSARRALTVRVLLVFGGLTLALAVVAAFAARPFIEVVYGPDFLPASEALLALLPGVVALACYTILSHYYYAVGTPPIAVLIPLVGLLINVGLNLVLIPAFGPVGAGAASSAAYLGILVFAAIAFARGRTHEEHA